MNERAPYGTVVPEVSQQVNRAEYMRLYRERRPKVREWEKAYGRARHRTFRRLMERYPAVYQRILAEELAAEGY